MATIPIRYIGPSDGVEIAATRQYVERNHQADVEENEAKKLLEQAVWERVKKPKKTTKKGSS